MAETENKLGELGLSISLLGSLGLFVAAYGHLEHTVHQVAYRYLEVGQEAGCAVLAGMRLRNLSTKMRQWVCEFSVAAAPPLWLRPIRSGRAATAW